MEHIVLKDLRDAIEECKKRAEMLVPPLYTSERTWTTLHTEVVDADGQRNVASAKNTATAMFIADRDPASVIRQCEVDLILVSALLKHRSTTPRVVKLAIIDSLSERYLVHEQAELVH